MEIQAHVQRIGPVQNCNEDIRTQELFDTDHNREC